MILMPDFAMALKSRISFRRSRYAGLMSICSVADLLGALAGPSESAFVTSASIALVTSGNEGAPSLELNFTPLYSAGLWEAVKLMAPSALRFVMAWEIAGV